MWLKLKVGGGEGVALAVVPVQRLQRIIFYGVEHRRAAMQVRHVEPPIRRQCLKHLQVVRTPEL